jgi:hypothetical protein
LLLALVSVTTGWLRFSSSVCEFRGEPVLLGSFFIKPHTF